MARQFSILVVDDEDDIRDIAAAILSSAGYRVLTAANGHEATRIIAAEHIDLLFTDVRMPGMSGIDLAIQAVSSRPDIQVIYSTGFVGNERDGRAAPYGRTIYKPWRGIELVQQIGNSLTYATAKAS